ncbi:transcriptional regulator [Candidatus Nitrosocosmicus hydrocola]|uniref:transcriptional regulator n=1 Tax=Candidatus Nitrosocosmicus hydrocola TaxID=1826872 RepID=UPI0039C88BA7
MGIFATATATTADISKYLNVSSSSVTKMVKKLGENNYLIYEKNIGLKLTADGITLVKNIEEKYSLFAKILKMICVDDNVAHLDAEGIEHHPHPHTTKRLEILIILLKKTNQVSNSKFKEKVNRYLSLGKKYPQCPC